VLGILKGWHSQIVKLHVINTANMPQLLQYVYKSQLVHINTILLSDSYIKSTVSKQGNAVLQELLQWDYTIPFWKSVVEGYTVLPSNTFLNITNKGRSQK